MRPFPLLGWVVLESRCVNAIQGEAVGGVRGELVGP